MHSEKIPLGDLCINDTCGVVDMVFGAPMPKPKVYLFVEKDNDECVKAENLLKSLGIPYFKIDIDENGIRGWMLKDFGTMKVPLIATSDAVVVGFKDIEQYLNAYKEKLST